jgi:hypothetical protein
LEAGGVVGDGAGYEEVGGVERGIERTPKPYPLTIACLFLYKSYKVNPSFTTQVDFLAVGFPYFRK